MSIIAETLTRLQSRSPNPSSKSPLSPDTEDPGENHLPFQKISAERPKIFQFRTIGFTLVLGGLALGSLWVGRQVDGRLAMEASAPVQATNRYGHPITTGVLQEFPMEGIGHESPSRLVEESRTIPTPTLTESVPASDGSPERIFNQTNPSFTPPSPSRPVQPPTTLSSHFTPSKSDTPGTGAEGVQLRNSDSQSPIVTKPQSGRSSPSKIPTNHHTSSTNSSALSAKPSGVERIPHKFSYANQPHRKPDHPPLTPKGTLASDATPPASRHQEGSLQEKPILSETHQKAASRYSAGETRTTQGGQDSQTMTKGDTPPQLAPPTDPLRSARRLIQEGHYHAALDILRPLFQTPPTSWEPWFWMGTAYLGSGDLEQADQHFLSGLARNNTIPQLWVQRALVAQQQGAYQMAVQELKYAESLHADLPHIHLNLGYAYDQLGNHRLAAQYYETFLRLTDGDPEFFPTRKKLLSHLTNLQPLRLPPTSKTPALGRKNEE